MSPTPTISAALIVRNEADKIATCLGSVRDYVDEIVTLPDSDIFDAMIWIMSHSKLVVEGAAAAPVAALLHGLIKAPAGSKVVAVLSGGNVNLEQLRGLKWN